MDSSPLDEEIIEFPEYAEDDKLLAELDDTIDLVNTDYNMYMKMVTKFVEDTQEFVMIHDRKQSEEFRKNVLAGLKVVEQLFLNCSGEVRLEKYRPAFVMAKELMQFAEHIKTIKSKKPARKILEAVPKKLKTCIEILERHPLYKDILSELKLRFKSVKYTLYHQYILFSQNFAENALGKYNGILIAEKQVEIEEQAPRSTKRQQTPYEKELHELEELMGNIAITVTNELDDDEPEEPEESGTEQGDNEPQEPEKFHMKRHVCLLEYTEEQSLSHFKNNLWYHLQNEGILQVVDLTEYPVLLSVEELGTFDSAGFCDDYVVMVDYDYNIKVYYVASEEARLVGELDGINPSQTEPALILSQSAFIYSAELDNIVIGILGDADTPGVEFIQCNFDEAVFADPKSARNFRAADGYITSDSDVVAYIVDKSNRVWKLEYGKKLKLELCLDLKLEGKPQISGHYLHYIERGSNTLSVRNLEKEFEQEFVLKSAFSSKNYRLQTSEGVFVIVDNNRDVFFYDTLEQAEIPTEFDFKNIESICVHGTRVILRAKLLLIHAELTPDGLKLIAKQKPEPKMLFRDVMFLDDKLVVCTRREVAGDDLPRQATIRSYSTILNKADGFVDPSFEMLESVNCDMISIYE